MRTFSQEQYDCSQVAGRLWVGAFPPVGFNWSKYTDVIVLCAQELQPVSQMYRGVSVLRAPLRDTADMTVAEHRSAMRAAYLVRKKLDLGKRVLVTCHMGLNRSGLVAALTMMLPPGIGRGFWTHATTPFCLNSLDAVRLIRRARGDYALSNVSFQRLLSRTDGICRSFAMAVSSGAMVR